MAADGQAARGQKTSGTFPGSLPFTFTTRSGTTLEGHLLTASDLEGLQRFNADLSDFSRGVFLPHAYDLETLSRYAERNRAGKDRAFVLYRGEELVGYYFLWDFDQPAPVLGIGLADAWQGQGLGRLMLRHLIEEARRAGRDAIELTTGLGNERAFRLYRRVGFELVGEVDNVAGDGRIVRERRMFLPLKPGVQPVERSFEPPTSPA